MKGSIVADMCNLERVEGQKKITLDFVHAKGKFGVMIIVDEKGVLVGSGYETTVRPISEGHAYIWRADWIMNGFQFFY